MPPIVIIGLGVSGLGCAIELTRRGIPFIGFEKESRPGGLARTEDAGGFHFDYGPHILLAPPAELEELFRDLPGLDLKVCSGKSGVIMDARLGTVIPAPFQRNLNWLPMDVRVRLLFAALTDHPDGSKAPANYAEYAIARCGKGVYDLFLRGYDTKRLRFNLDEIPPDWTNRIEKTRLRSLVLPRALTDWLGGNKRESRFGYPHSGGIEALPRAMARLLPADSIRCSCEVIGIDAAGKIASFGDGMQVRYDHLVLSLPLPEIISLIRDVPSKILRAAEDLIHSSIYVVSLGLEGAVPPWSLLRVPDARWGFYRISFPSHYAPGAAPPGSSAVVGEISHHPVRYPLSAGDAREELRRGLEELGIVHKGQRIVAETTRDIRYGHVLYNHGTRESVRLILDFLKSHSILVCGKYGSWKDMLIPESIRSGMAAAREVILKNSPKRADVIEG
jgi:protoporphyrinogen oxidase